LQIETQLGDCRWKPSWAIVVVRKREGDRKKKGKREMNRERKTKSERGRESG
jgi:hypothetical protein